MRFLSQNVNND